VLVLMTFGSTAFASDVRLDAAALYAAACDAFTAGRFAESAQLFNEFATRYDDEPAMTGAMGRVYYALGCAHFNAQEMQQAVTTFDRHLSLWPASPYRAEVLYRIAVAHQALGNVADAIDSYQRLLRDVPAFAQAEDARLQCALCHLAHEDYNTALPLLQQLASHAKNPRVSVAAQLQLPLAWYHVGQPAAALSALVCCISGDAAGDELGSLSLFALQLGDCFADQFEFERALAAYRCVLRRDEMLSRLKQQLLVLRSRRDRQAHTAGTNWLALADIQRLDSLLAYNAARIAEMHTNVLFDALWLMRLGRCLYDMGQLWEACIAFEEVTRQLGTCDEAKAARQNLIYCLIQMRLFERARKEIGLFVRMYPASADLATMEFLHCETLINEELFAEAECALLTLLQKYPEHPNKDRAEFYLYLSQALQEKFVEAQVGFARWRTTRMYTNSSVAADVQYWDAMTWYYSGDYSNALLRLEAFSTAWPGSRYESDVHYRIIVTHYMLERYYDAAVGLARWLQTYPEHPMIWEARILRGDALAALGELERAVAAYGEAGTNSGPYYHYAVAQMGKCYKALENYTNLLALYETYTRAVPDSPNLVEGLYWLGWAHGQLGNAAEACEIYWRALLDHGNNRAWWGFDDIVRELSRFYNAGDGAATFALRLREESAAARSRGKLTLASRLQMALHALCLRRGDTSAAHVIAHAFAAQFATNVLGPDGLIFLARHADATGHLAVGAAYYQHILSAFPRSTWAAEAALRVAQDAQRHGDTGTAYRLLLQAESLVQDVALAAEITAEHAAQLHAAGDLHGALQKYEEILANRAARGPLWPQALFGIGSIHEELRDYRKAIAYYQRIYVLYAGHAELCAKAYYHSARCFEHLQQFEAAVSSYRELLESASLLQFDVAGFARERLALLTASVPEETP